ncbi:MAG: VirB3 family type IV secretion system protein [Novosphingobium sp.]
MAATPLARQIVFVALTRPQMFAGVTYTFFIINGIIAAELFLVFKALWVIAVAGIIHLIGVVACLREPRFFDLWISRVRHCPRVKNFGLWGCNSYAP